MKTFGVLLRELRESRGMTVNQLGIYSEVSPALISKIENGKRGTPKPDTIEKLAKGLKMPYEELMAVAGYVDEGKEIPKNVTPYADIMKEIADKYPGVDLNDQDIRRKLMKVIDLVLDDYKKK